MTRGRGETFKFERFGIFITTAGGSSLRNLSEWGPSRIRSLLRHTIIKPQDTRKRGGKKQRERESERKRKCSDFLFFREVIVISSKTPSFSSLSSSFFLRSSLFLEPHVSIGPFAAGRSFQTWKSPAIGAFRFSTAADASPSHQSPPVSLDVGRNLGFWVLISVNGFTAVIFSLLFAWNVIIFYFFGWIVAEGS